VSKLTIGTQADGTPATLGGFEARCAEGKTSARQYAGVKAELRDIWMRALGEGDREQVTGNRDGRAQGEGYMGQGTGNSEEDDGQDAHPTRRNA